MFLFSVVLCSVVLVGRVGWVINFLKCGYSRKHPIRSVSGCANVQLSSSFFSRYVRAATGMHLRGGLTFSPKTAAEEEKKVATAFVKQGGGIQKSCTASSFPELSKIKIAAAAPHRPPFDAFDKPGRLNILSAIMPRFGFFPPRQ